MASKKYRASNLWRNTRHKRTDSRRRPCEGNDPLAEANDGELEKDGAVGGVEEEDLVELLALVLPPPEVEHAQLRPVAGCGRREPHLDRPVEQLPAETTGRERGEATTRPELI
jgi:hypothetical protein